MSSASSSTAKNSSTASSKTPKESSAATASSSSVVRGSSEATSSTAASEERPSADQVDADLLPILHDIIRTIEKDNQDVSQKNKDSLEASVKVQEIHAKIAALRQQIYKLPGIERSREEQLRRLDVLKQQLQMKKKLIIKYKELNLKVSGLSGQNSSC